MYKPTTWTVFGATLCRDQSTMDRLEERLADAGLPAKRRTDILSTVRLVARHIPTEDLAAWVCGGDLDAASADADLRRAFSIATAAYARNGVYTRRYHLKMALQHLTDGSAHRRFPLFWTDGRLARRLTGRDISADNALPFPIFRQGRESPLARLFSRVLQQLRLRSTMRRPSSLRKALGFLFRFCFTDPRGLHLAPVIPPLDGSEMTALLAPLRAQTHASVVAAYRRYRTGRPAVRLAVLTRHIHLLSLLFHRVLRILPRPLTPVAFGLPAAQPQARRGRTAGRLDDQRSNTNTTVSDRAAGAWIRPSGPSPAERVHTFAADEIRRLYLACDSLFERIVLTTLFTTGIRIDRARSMIPCRSRASVQRVLQSGMALRRRRRHRGPRSREGEHRRALRRVHRPPHPPSAMGGRIRGGTGSGSPSLPLSESRSSRRPRGHQHRAPRISPRRRARRCDRSARPSAHDPAYGGLVAERLPPSIRLVCVSSAKAPRRRPCTPSGTPSTAWPGSSAIATAR